MKNKLWDVTVTESSRFGILRVEAPTAEEALELSATSPVRLVEWDEDNHIQTLVPYEAMEVASE